MAGLVAIVGPTATGKSALALDLAESLGGEIINADSRQVYRYMDIGTAKPPTQDLDRAPHHLYDLVNPDEAFNLALYLQQANLAVDDIYSRGRVPTLVGGSGLYVWGFLEGMAIPHVPPNPDLRARLEEEAATLGPSSLSTTASTPLTPTLLPTSTPETSAALSAPLKSSKSLGCPSPSRSRKKASTIPF